MQDPTANDVIRLAVEKCQETASDFNRKRNSILLFIMIIVILFVALVVYFGVYISLRSF